MKRKGFICYLLSPAVVALMVSCNSIPKEFNDTGELLDIYPDYTGTVVPPNIAPLNFRVKNLGENFTVVLTNSAGREIQVSNSEGRIKFPIRAWKKFLEEGRGGDYSVEVYRENKEGGWDRLQQGSNRIADQEIDGYVAYRKIPPANIYWKEMNIRQRSLETFEDLPIMVNDITNDNCMNCHSFNAGNPEQMTFHMRGEYGGTLVKNGKETRFVNTKSDHTMSSGVYPSWHPDGEIIAYSANKINQAFHSKIGKVDYVFDRYSDILLYDTRENSITRPAELATESMENLPSWSVDGNSLYYICAPKFYDSVPYYKSVYSLMQISFDKETRKFGLPDTLIDGKQFGKSITFPRENPSRDIVSFIGVDYGYFSIHNEEADIYFFNKETGEITLEEHINSKHTESYPSWSSNGSWILFVSKRDDGILSVPWFSYVDEAGKPAKPFMLPQEDPIFYKEYMYNYNRPEFITGKVKLNPRKIFAIVKSGTEEAGFNEDGSVSLTSGATIPAGEPQAEHYHHD